MRMRTKWSSIPYEVSSMEDGQSTSELVQIVAELRREVAAHKAEQAAEAEKAERALVVAKLVASRSEQC